LIYDSQSTAPQPILLGLLLGNAAGNPPTSISESTTWNGGAAQATESFNTSGLPSGTDYFLRDQNNATVSSTGYYSWTLNLLARFNGHGDVRRYYIGNSAVVNNVNSAFGPGWSLAGLDYCQRSCETDPLTII
jgi:hypothetical protein